MTQTVTLEVPAELLDRARAVAKRTGQRLEDVLVEWMKRSETSHEEPSDEEILALCDSQLAESTQDELSDLLEQQREGQLQESQKERLEELLQAYRRGMVREGTLHLAVSRGLRLPLGEK